ncbi:gfo/Idh/MocA family oxidoreductase, partial [Candidatus Sumerlaeota bacterium]|nr:gfo/Idh/MocA family oxidoreductase [Candidatus Sumerlaeota bacterium]
CDYEYPNGVHVMSMSRHWDGCEGGVFEEAIGTKGRKSCDAMGEKGIDPYVQEHIDLVKGIRGEGPKWHEGVQVAESTLTSIMGRMSAYTGKTVKWDEALNSDLSIVPDPLNFEAKIPVWSVPCPVSTKKL